MADITWEAAVQVFASSKDYSDVTPRSLVAGSDRETAPWANLGTSKVYGPSESPVEVDGFPDIQVNLQTQMLNYAGTWDTWYFTFAIFLAGEVFGYPAGQNGNAGGGGKPPSDYHKFMAYPTIVLGPLTAGGESDRVSVASFHNAANVWNFVHDWVVDRTAGLKAHVDQLESTGDLSGDTADGYKATLRGIEDELRLVYHNMDPTTVAAALNDAAQALNTAIRNLYDSYLTWYHSNPGNAAWVYKQALWSAFFEEPKPTISITSTSDAVLRVTISTRYGDPTTGEFWKAVDLRAKQDWLDGMKVLDTSAARELRTLADSYVHMVGKLKGIQEFLDPISLKVDPPKTDAANGGLDPESISRAFENNNKNLAGLADANAKGLNDLASITSKTLQDFGVGISQGLDGFGNSLKGGLDGNLFAGNGGLGSSLVDANGRPILDASGTPITAPGGSRILADGSIVDANGKPILGADGKPLTAPAGARLVDSQAVMGPDNKPVLAADGTPLIVPKGSKINADGTITGPDGTLIKGADGNPLKVPAGSKLQSTTADLSAFQIGGPPLVVPPGSTVTSTGAVLDSHGKPVLGPGGQPLQVAPGSTINADGTVIGPDGQPVSRPPLTSDLLSSAALTSGGLLPGSGLRLGPFGSGSGLTSTTTSPLEPVGFPATGVAAAAAEAAAFGRTPSSASMTAAEEAIAEQAQIIGRANAAEAGPPFMPPMTGGPGGTVGGAAQKRRTWLEEDEEVWGTESKTLPGVIGRQSGSD